MGPEDMGMEDSYLDASWEDRYDLDHLNPDPYADSYLPGYATEMDYMNACEADDYRDEGEDW